MIHEAAPEGGATINANEPQPKGRPTEEHEIICDRCSLRPCKCDDEFTAAMAALLFTMAVANGIPLPLRSCFRHVGALISGGWLRPLDAGPRDITPEDILHALDEGADGHMYIEVPEGRLDCTVLDGGVDMTEAAALLNQRTKGHVDD